MTSRHPGHQPEARRGRRGNFRAWRRSRPFWGGLLMLLAGIELLAIPLSGVLIQGQVKLVIYIGIGGVFGVLMGVLLLAAGIVVWVNPTHRVFYGIAGIILGILSFPASNLGGFFIGMLLAIIGGALSFAWSPADPAPERRPDRPAGPSDTRVDLPALMDDDPPRQNRRPSGGYGSGSGSGSGSGFGGPSYRMLALAGLPCILFCASTSPSPSPSPSASPSASSSSSAASPSGGAKNPVGQVVQSAAGAVNSAAGAAKSAAGAAAKSAASAAKSKSGKKNAAKKATPVGQVKAPSGLIAPSTPSELTAKSSTLTKLNLVGVTTLPVGGGGSEKVLEFTAASGNLSSVGISVTQAGHTVLTKTSSLSMPDGMTLYTTKLCGQVEGIVPNICFTPSTVSQVVLKLASVLGQVTPITMTNVSASQFLNVANTSQWGTLTMGAE